MGTLLLLGARQLLHQHTRCYASTAILAPIRLAPTARPALVRKIMAQHAVPPSDRSEPPPAVGSSSNSSNSAARPEYLRALSAAQYGAVTAPPDEPLQILAGPGSGKTRVLVARVAWLILERNVNPRDLVVVTFTNKAAKEMRKRLHGLIGLERTSLLILGTFHATCARYLRQHASLVGLENNFSICDSDQTKAAIKAIIKDEGVQAQLAQKKLPQQLKPELIISEISRAKAKDFDVNLFDQWLAALESGNITTTGSNTRGRPECTAIRRAVSVVFRAYSDYLRKNNALDFDDLLLYGVKLFRTHARVTANICHVLVDEFQDTNTIQYALMATLSGRGGSRGAVSIVGDPDQSIYGWRSAEIGNLKKMAEEFAEWSSSQTVLRVFLEENYRSTAHILQTAKAIIDCDSNRIERGLYTSHAKGPPPMCKQFSNSQLEAQFVAAEIKRLIAASGGMLGYDDFAILLRFNALSREVENRLQAENIPLRMLGGARFFERKEVKDLLAYLTLADNPNFTPAMERVINVPKRSIGDKSIRDILQVAETEGSRAMVIVDRIASAKKPIMGFRPAVQSSLRGFVSIIKDLRSMARRHEPVASIIEKAIELTGYEAYLRKEPDFEQRWLNVKELINFATLIEKMQEGEQVESPELSALSHAATQTSNNVVEISSSEEPEEKPKPQARHTEKTVNRSAYSLSPDSSRDERSASVSSARNEAGRQGLFAPVGLLSENKSPLCIFLEAATLSTDAEQEDEDGQKPKVTIATTHAAKGLEFPVVFLLSVEEGTYPFYRANGTTEEIDEEARLLYVGITRAQVMIYLTHCQSRLVNGQQMDKVLSRFVSPAADPKDVHGGKWGQSVQIGYDGQSSAPVTCEKVPYTSKRPAIGADELSAMAAVLHRPLPPTERTARLMLAFENSDVAARLDRAERSDGSSSLSSYTSHSSANNLSSRPFWMSSSESGAQRARSHISPQTSSIGFSTAGTAMRATHNRYMGSSYDADGWAVETRAGTASAAASRPHASVLARQIPKYSTSTFMDPYRASKGGAASDGVVNSTGLNGAHERPMADAARFKAKNDSSISDILSMLPDDGSKSTAKGQSSSFGQSARSLPHSKAQIADARQNTNSRSHIPLAGAGSSKRRLGMGHAPPLLGSKAARREQEK